MAQVTNSGLLGSSYYFQLPNCTLNNQMCYILFDVESYLALPIACVIISKIIYIGSQIIFPESYCWRQFMTFSNFFNDDHDSEKASKLLQVACWNQTIFSPKVMLLLNQNVFKANEIGKKLYTTDFTLETCTRVVLYVNSREWTPSLHQTSANPMIAMEKHPKLFKR